MAVNYVNYYIVEAKDGQTALERFTAMEKDAKAFYAVGGDLYQGANKLNNAADIAAAIAALSASGGAIYQINQTLTKLEGEENVTDSIRNIIKGYFDAYDSGDLLYQAAQGDPGDPDYVAAVYVEDALNDLYSQIGAGGAVADQIEAAVNALDAEVSITDTQDTNPLNITITEVDGVLTSVTGSIDANTFDTYGSAAAVLGESTDAATANTVYGAKAAAAAAQTDVDALETLVGTGYGTKVVDEQTVNKTVKEYIDGEIAEVSGDADALEARVEANEDAIELLNKTDGTAGSVKKTVDDAIAAVVAEAPASFDTLKEISDWISSHADSASAMNSQIQANTAAIGVASDPTADPAVAATGLHKKIEDGLSDEETRAATAEGALEDRIEALEALAGDESVADQIDDAIEALDTASDVAVASKDTSTNVVTITGSIKEEDGIIAKGTGTDITLAAVAATGAAADITVADAGSNFGANKDLESVLAEIAGKIAWQTV